MIWHTVVGGWDGREREKEGTGVGKHKSEISY